MRKVKERYEQEFMGKLEEREEAHAEKVRRMREQNEGEVRQAVAEAEMKMQKQHEWQLRDIREE